GELGSAPVLRDCGRSRVSLQAPDGDTVQRYGTFIVQGLYMFLGSLFDAAADGIDLQGTTWTSWWRSPADNLRVGGQPTSQHLKALAYDVSGPAAAAIAAKWALRGGSVVDERATKNHVHLQVFPAGRSPD